MSSESRFIVVLGIDPDTAVGWLARAKAVRAATEAHASLFTSIATVLARLAQDVDTVDEAQAAAANRGRSQISERDARLVELKKSFRAVRDAVQGLCDDAPDWEHAAEIAAAAGFGEKKAANYRKPDFYAKVLGNGRVQLFVKVPGYRGSRVYYEWAMSSDGGLTWVELPGTNDADTIVEGLPEAKEILFRHRTTMKSVVSSWSRSLPVLVH
jgi:hypothetical protein